MGDEELSRRDDRRLHRALKSVLLTEFPNPGRTGCPGPDILQAIAGKRLPMRHAAFEHIGKCSPCFAEVRDHRRHIQLRRIVSISGIGIAIFVAFAIGLSFRQSLHNSPDATPSAANQNMSLDLRPYSVTRSEVPSGAVSLPPLQMGRAVIALAVYLPVGAEEGTYEVQIQKDAVPVIIVPPADAQIENHVTTLRINLDARPLKAGDYQLALRQIGLSWRFYPLTIR